jgi:hypothetical protein
LCSGRYQSTYGDILGFSIGGSVMDHPKPRTSRKVK